jgi:hypothetical protein
MIMKKIKFLLTFVLAAIALGCSEDDNSLDSLTNGPAPANISALFTITQDNSGLVTIAPHGEAISHFKVYYGDNTQEPGQVLAGNTINHTYAEGVYNVKVVGISVNGKTAEYNHELTVAFTAPVDVVPVITPVTGNSMAINVTATATNEAYFEVMYGEDPAQEPEQFNEGTTLTHQYTTPGTYTVTITAFSGGVATTTVTQTVTVTNPLLLPIDFESSTLNYAFADFGGAATSVVTNPNPGGINTSSKVGRFIKTAGAETWAGTAITLDAPIDFASMHYFRVKVWSPAAGTPVLLKVENLTNNSIAHEVQATTTVANGWEYLTYNFSGVNMSQTYSKVILFFNFNNPGAGQTYYFDDITLIPGDAGVGLPLTFENSSLTYVFEDFGGAFGAKIANPVSGGINTSANVGRYVKNSGAETWAGIVMPMAAPIDFSVNQKIKMKVYSPAAGKIVLLKFENLTNSAINIERQATTTVANGWEELTFDFTGINNASNFQKVVLFFDFNVAGTGSTYYFDDIQQFN